MKARKEKTISGVASPKLGGGSKGLILGE